MKWSTKENEKLARLYKSGMCNVDIAVELKRTTKSVERQISKIRKEYGLVGRPRKYSDATEARLAANRKAREKYTPRPKKPRKTDDPRYRLWNGCKVRAKKQGVPFNLTMEDIVIPETCPLLGTPLERGVGTWTDNSPTVDKVVPSKGYVKGNIMVISFRANRIKQDASVEELEAVARGVRNFLNH